MLTKIKEWFKKHIATISRYGALVLLLLIIDGTLGFKYAVLGFLIYVFAMPVVVLLTRFKQVREVYKMGVTRGLKFFTGKDYDLNAKPRWRKIR